jgi:hypothetical protein
MRWKPILEEVREQRHERPQQSSSSKIDGRLVLGNCVSGKATLAVRDAQNEEIFGAIRQARGACLIALFVGASGGYFRTGIGVEAAVERLALCGHILEQRRRLEVRSVRGD